jgi:NNP family nitrate/nitrite transporter-like MFS transporter
MHFRDFRHAGNGRVLFSAFLYFDMSFMVWVLMGALGSFIAEDLGLSASEKGLITATPLLAGSAFRLILGPLSDHIGSRKAGLAGLVLTLVPLATGWLFADSLATVILVGLMLGVAGASFAVALPLASRWYPPEHQGLAMGIAGAGNSGTVLASLFAPRFAQHFGWQPVFGLAMIPILLTMIVFFFLAKDSPNHPPAPKLGAYLGSLRRAETLWFSLFYSVTFGGFVGLSSYLAIFFRDEYGITKVHAGDLTALCVFTGSLLRPVGGLVSDKLGGVRVLTLLLGVVAALMSLVALLPPLWLIVALFILTMGTLGMGNGAVFQLIPQVFRKEIGVITGLVGAAGGVGGFYLPTVLGSLKGSTGTYSSGFVAFAAAAVVALGLLFVARSRLVRSAAHAFHPVPSSATISAQALPEGATAGGN